MVSFSAALKNIFLFFSAHCLVECDMMARLYWRMHTEQSSRFYLKLKSAANCLLPAQNQMADKASN